MESYQAIQNRTHQTIAVIKQYDPGLRIGGIDVAHLIAQSDALQGLARQRDEAQAEYDIANNAEQQGYLAIRDLVLTLPKAAEVELNDNDPSQSVLLDLLAGVYALSPRNTELAVARGTKLLTALNKVNAFLAAQNPPLPEVTSAGRGIAALAAALDAQPALERALEDRLADLNNARGVLRNGCAELDRGNKRFYAKLKAEARNNADLANALNQIDTLGAGFPSTLSIKTLLQGGTEPGNKAMPKAWRDVSRAPAKPQAPGGFPQETCKVQRSGVESLW
jgi:hypothetical protein